jgi:hypothetical protein
MRHLRLLAISITAFGLMVGLLAGAVALGTPAAAAPRIACRAGQPCAYFGVMTTANPGAIGNELLATAVVSSSDAWAGGRRWEHAGSVARRPASRGPKQGCGCAYYALTEHYNGSTWSVVPVPTATSPGGFLFGVVAAGLGNLWAVGYLNDSMTGSATSLIERYNGSAWTQQAAPLLTPAEPQSLLAVSASPDGTALAVGYYPTSAANGAVQTLAIQLGRMRR